MTATLFDDRVCELGEGPLWHPGRGQLFWFDILGHRLLSRTDNGPVEWQFDECGSAAGWIDDETLLIAGETGLRTFDLGNGKQEFVCPLPGGRVETRTNDGRADPNGGFWISTMGKSAEPGAGAFHRYYRGEVRTLRAGISIPNALCFAPDGRRAYFCDTAQGQITTQTLDREGWPSGDVEVFLDLRNESLNPDGAVTDAEGNLWNAQWGASRVAGYRPDGSFIAAYRFPACHTSCPALGGADFSTLYCTTAREHLTPEFIAAHPENGQTFAVASDIKGRPEPRVIL